MKNIEVSDIERMNFNEILEDNKDQSEDVIKKALQTRFKKVLAGSGSRKLSGVMKVIVNKGVYEKEVKLDNTTIDLIVYIYKKVYPKDITRGKWMQELRQIILEDKPTAELAAYVKQNLKLTKAEYKAQDDKRIVSRDAKHEEPLVIHYDQYIDIIKSLVDADTIGGQLAFLMGLSGRRAIEVLTSTFDKLDSKDYVAFSGKGKLKAHKKEDSKLTLEIPMLIKGYAPVFLAKLKEFRKEQDPEVKRILAKYDGDRKQISNHYSRYINEKARQLFPEQVESKKTKARAYLLRKAYGSITFKVYRPKITLNLWLKDVLGHDVLETSLHYAGVVIIGGPGGDSKDLETMSTEMKALNTLVSKLNLEDRPHLKQEVKSVLVELKEDRKGDGKISEATQAALDWADSFKKEYGKYPTIRAMMAAKGEGRDSGFGRGTVDKARKLFKR